MSFFLKHAAEAASADSRTALQHAQHARHHGAGNEIPHTISMLVVHNRRITPAANFRNRMPTSKPRPYHSSSRSSSCSRSRSRSKATSSLPITYGGPIQNNNDIDYQQQQGYQQSFQPPYGAPDQYNNNPIYQQQQQQYNVEAQAASDNQQAADNALFAAQLSAATAPQPPYNVQDTTDNPVPPVGSYTDPNVVVADPGYNASGEGTVDRQDYGSAAAYQPTPTADPSIGATQGDRTTSNQSQPQQTMDTSAGFVRGDEDGGYQPASAMDATAMSA